MLPVLVVEVQEHPSDAEMTDFSAPIFGSWDDLSDENVVNTFGEHTPSASAATRSAYMAPQDIQDDNDIRVVLCKDAILDRLGLPSRGGLGFFAQPPRITPTSLSLSVGWSAHLSTRRITTDQTLNEVHCFLPQLQYAPGSSRSLSDSAEAKATSRQLRSSPTQSALSATRVSLRRSSSCS